MSTVSLRSLRAGAMLFNTERGMPIVKAMLAERGASKLSDIPPEGRLELLCAFVERKMEGRLRLWEMSQ